MRIQLAVPNNHFVTPQVFNRMFTMHGTTMVFLRRHADPVRLRQLPRAADDRRARHGLSAAERLRLLGSPPSAACCCTSASSAARASTARAARRTSGWFAYAPLTAKAFSRGHSHRLLDARRSSSWASARSGPPLNIVTTTICMRCPGMTLTRMPLLVWMMLTMSAHGARRHDAADRPRRSCCSIDRYLGGHFFDTQAGGSAVLWQHFFWIFGHPEVYVLIIPGFAFVSEIIPVFSRKAIFGYPAMVAATVGIGFLVDGRVGAPHVHGRHDARTPTPSSR